MVRKVTRNMNVLPVSLIAFAGGLPVSLPLGAWEASTQGVGIITPGHHCWRAFHRHHLHCPGHVSLEQRFCNPEHHLTENTLVMFTSDNGPVVDDGYRDDAVEKLGDHRPAGLWRGGKYSNFEGGTRVPWIVSWPGRVPTGRSRALVCQVDLVASFAAFTDQEVDKSTAPDSQNVMPALLGDDAVGRDHLVEQARTQSLRQGEWKYIPPNPGARINRSTNTEVGSDPSPQLYHLEQDPAESTNVAAEQCAVVERLDAQLQSIRQQGR